MAEPVSIIAGVVTILRVSLSALAILKSARASPAELARLERELQHLGDVVSEVDEIANGQGHMTDGLTRNVMIARLQVQQINEFIQSRMYRANSKSLKIRRIALFKESFRLRGFARDIESTRSKLADCLAISNLYVERMS